MSTAIDLFYPGIAIIPLIFAGIGSYLGSYLKKKGENLATHEDLDKLVEQVAAVTQATKSIEAAISDDLWNKQKRWELKREVLFEAAKRLAEVDDALLCLNSVSKLDHQQIASDWEEKKGNAQQRWLKASRVFQETKVLVGIVCEKETIAAFDQFDSLGTNIFVKICKEGPEAYANSKTDYMRNLLAARATIRKELRVDEAAALQLSASSTVASLRPQSF
ncbi:MAG: hypothetical protein ABSC48_18325 [Terracidiphilus sp.]|jgi:hypothetical protein